MTIQTTTHLNFRGDARRALEFYREAFDGVLVVNTYADFGMPAELPGADGVVFGLVVAENGFRVMAYDAPAPGRAASSAAVRRIAQTTRRSAIKRCSSRSHRTASKN